MKCLKCGLTFSESDIGVMEDWDLQLCDACESEASKLFEKSLDKWDFLKLELNLFKRGKNKSTARAATEVLKLMQSIDYRYQRLEE
jgi:hypothetical protein